MNLHVELRHLVPPLLNLLLVFLQNLQVGNIFQVDSDDHLMLKLVFFLFIAVVTFLFLFTSIKLRLTVRATAGAIHLGAEDFSFPVAILLLCSIFLSPQHFWVGYPIIFSISIWYASVFNLVKRFFIWFYHTLQELPTLIVTCFIQEQDEHPEQEPPVGVVEV